MPTDLFENLNVESEELGTERSRSTIPIADPSCLPGHQQGQAQEEEKARWLYPSETMFFKAMKRKE
jgi:hypothetical protein